MTEREMLAVVREALMNFEQGWMGEANPATSALAALSELEARAEERERGEEDVFVWPVRVKDAAIGSLGQLGGRTYAALDRRIKHAWRVWEDKYGRFNPEQAEYANAVLENCFTLPPDVIKPVAWVLHRLDQAVHHEVVHAGFLRRSSEPDTDILRAIAEAAT